VKGSLLPIPASRLSTLERGFPGSQPLHLIVDREGTHTQAYARAWLERR